MIGVLIIQSQWFWLTFGASRASVPGLAFTNIGLNAFSVIAVLGTDGDTTGAVGTPSVTFATNLHRTPLGNHLKGKSKYMKYVGSSIDFWLRAPAASPRSNFRLKTFRILFCTFHHVFESCHFASFHVKYIKHFLKNFWNYLELSELCSNVRIIYNF